MGIKRIPVKTAAVLLAGLSVGTLFFKPVKAESAMLSSKADTTNVTREMAIANYEKECPNLAKWLTGAARERAIAYAANAKGLTYVTEGLPAMGEAREEDVKPLAINTSAIDELNDQINKYSDLTAPERAKLGEKVLENGDAGLVSRYNSAKKAYGAPAPAEGIAGPVDMDEAPAAVETVEAQPSAASIPEKAAEVDIGALYDQVNGYPGLDANERAELDAEVMESGNASLIGYYTKVKKNASPVEMATPDAAAEPAKADSAVIQAVEEISQPIKEAEKVEKKEDRPVETPVPAEVKTEPADEPVEKVAETAPRDMSVLKDSLQDAISACQDRINLMSKETFAADSAAIADAIGGIGAIMGKGLPAGDAWAEYKLRHLKEYFSGACERFSGKSGQQMFQ